MIFDLDLERVRNRPGIKWERHGSDVLSAWVADMDVEVPDFIKEAVVARINEGGLGYGFYDEPIPVLEAFKSRMSHAFDWNVETGRNWVANPLMETEDGWALDFDHLDQVAARDDVSALLLCHPHNPCGYVMTSTDLVQIIEIADRHDLVVISDEIHCDLVYSPHKHIPAASISELAAQRTVTLTAATKTFNMAGLRMALSTVLRSNIYHS